MRGGRGANAIVPAAAGAVAVVWPVHSGNGKCGFYARAGDWGDQRHVALFAAGLGSARSLCYCFVV